MQRRRTCLESFVRPAAVALVALFALTSSAMRATTHLNPLEVELQRQSDALVGDLEKQEKKDKKLFDGLLKQLGKTTDSPKKEIKLAKKVGGKLSKKKPDDALFNNLLSDAAGALGADVTFRLGTVKAGLNSLPTKVTVEKILKKVDAGEAKMRDSVTQATFVKRMVRIAQAESAARSAEKLLAKFGGGGNCPGQKFGAGEGASVKKDGVTITFDQWVFEPAPQTGHRYFNLYRCNPQVELSILIRFPQLGENAIGDGRNDDFVTYRESFTDITTGGAVGTNDVTVYDNRTGEINAAFSFTNPDGTFTEGTLVLKDFFR